MGRERRADRRYEIMLDVRWTLIYRRRALDSGNGITVDVSSGGILFATDRELPLGREIELSISWPVLKNQKTPLRLNVKGYIVRATGQHVAVRINHYAFSSDTHAALQLVLRF
jgi:PilZ domain